MTDERKCAKNHCTSTGCTLYSPNFGYICDRCYADLIEWCTNSNVLVPGVIESFLTNPKQPWRHDRQDEAKTFLEKVYQKCPP